MGTGPLSLGLSMWRRHRKDPGLALLESALGWWDVQAVGALTTVDTTVSADLTTWAKNCTVVGGQADPDGGTGAYRVSSTVTGAYLRAPSDAAKCYGYVRASCKIKVDESHTLTSLQFGIEPNSQQYLVLPKASLETAARDNAIPYSTVAGGSPLGWRYEDIGGGWRYVEIEGISRSGNIALAKQHPHFLLNQASAVSTTIADIYDVQLFHRRASAVADRNGGTALTQATADSRQSLMDTGIVGRPALVGSIALRQSSSAALAVGAGPWLLSVVGVAIETEFAGTDPVAVVTGATGNAALTVVGGTAVARAQWGWTWTTDAGVTTSGTFGGKVTTTPVCAQLRYDGSALRLYIDGQQVGSDASVAGTLTGTGVTLGSSLSEFAWASAAIRSAATTDTQAAQVAATLRSRAGLPSAWIVDLWSGQSNAVNLDASTRRAYAGARFTAGPAIACHDRDGSGNYNPCPLVPAARPYWVAYLDRRVVAGGPARGYQRAATRNGAYHRIVASMGKGGTAIASWLTPGQELYDHLRVAWPAVLADVGTHLVIPGDILWTQGEADTADPVGYAGKLAEFASETRAMMGTAARFVLHRLNTGYAGSYPENNDALRAEQDAFVAADGNAAMTHGDYPVGDHFDGIHYSTHGAACHGENKFLEPRGLTPITDPSTVP